MDSKCPMVHAGIHLADEFFSFSSARQTMGQKQEILHPERGEFYKLCRPQCWTINIVMEVGKLHSRQVLDIIR